MCTAVQHEIFYVVAPRTLRCSCSLATGVRKQATRREYREDYPGEAHVRTGVSHVGSEVVRRELQGHSAEGDHCPPCCSPAPSGVADMVPDILGSARTIVSSLLYTCPIRVHGTECTTCTRSKGQPVPAQKICTHPRISEGRDDV